jgi:transcriptional regulator with XRE-family HTH domain
MNKLDNANDALPKENRIKFGDKIRSIREKRGFSQDDLAEMMEISRSTISKIENGKFAISIDYIFKIGQHLNFDFDITENKNK